MHLVRYNPMTLIEHHHLGNSLLCHSYVTTDKLSATYLGMVHDEKGWMKNTTAMNMSTLSIVVL